MTNRDEIKVFFDEYQKALTAYDAERAAAHWGTPGTIIADGFIGSAESTAEMAEGLATGYPFYRRLGLASVGYTLLETVDLTRQIVRVRVRWHFYDAQGALLTDSDYEYLLRRDGGGLHAYVAVAIDETEKLSQLAAAKGVEVPAR
ncbi:hypothetical protein [Nocardia sp. XZ_19_385]|uniref:hypothetical protein n=1 Tax=Nocardia sp. XZ_19_385 TaxID=2769488 RepID=UPI00188EBEFF|nr:hypothetical protein [Nocardia sp. XZ_19_385]